MSAYTETFWHDVNGTLSVRFPRNCRVSLSGSKYHGFELTVHRVIPQQLVRAKKKTTGRRTSTGNKRGKTSAR